MKSTEIIHEIVDDYGMEDKQGLMRLLKDLREQVSHEVKAALFQNYNHNRKIMTRDFLVLVNHYEKGT